MNTILIMDEDQQIQMLYAEELFDEGYDVLTCSNPSDLMQLVDQKRPDLVIMEVLFKNYDGLELLQKISHTYKEIPVILFTAYPAFKQDLRSRAAFSFLVKSSNLKSLKAMIEHALNRETPRSPSQYDHKIDRLYPINWHIFP